MKKLLFLAIICLITNNIAKTQSSLIIPSPQQVDLLPGVFVLNPSSEIISPQSLREIAELFAETVKDLLGFKPCISAGGKSDGNIVLILDNNMPDDEGYELKITASDIEITAKSAAGAFYGLQSLHQLLISVENNAIPAQIIKDAPRFAWRGAMLDVSRTFMPVNLIKRYIDLFASYKLNVLHLHLTDDQGWRMEIRKYPLLTEVGSKFDAKFNTMGGYYSQDDIRDLVRFAKIRNITTVPEIELPGHSSAAITAYPWLSCNGVRPGIHTFFEGPSIHKEIFCAGKPEVYEFIFNVIDELTELFPSKYIHIGGDEAPKDEWKKCSFCQQTMKENNLNDEEELQSYFVKRIGEHLRNRDRILIGWDEIYDGGKLEGDEVLMYWRGWKADSIETAAEKGFKIISCPTTCCYFDYDYDKTNTRKVFDYNPVPQNASKETSGNYLGIQANFWSHIDRSEDNIDKQLFPRLLGLAETAWTYPENSKWDDFRIAALKNAEYLKKNHVNIYDDESLEK